MLFNYMWLRSASIFCCLLLSLSAFGQSAYTTYSRYDSQGHLLGTIAPDPDGSGSLHYPATRNTYSSSTGLLMRSEVGELSTWFDENTMPASWSGFTVYSSKSYVYDAQGRKITEKSYGKNSVLIGLIQYTYDSFNRVQCVAQRLNFAVDPALYPNACYLAPEGSYGPDRITRYSYDATYGVVLTEERALRTTLQQTYVTNTYSGGLLSSQTDANNNKTELYYYPDTKWLKRIVYPSKTKGASNANGTELGTAGDYVEFQYDLNGNKIKERKRSGAIINYTYDDNDRLIEKDLADNSKDVCYNYDLRGLQTEARFGSNPLACSGYGVISNYDGFGRLSSSQNTTLGANLTLNYAYDNNGNRIGIKHPDGVKFGYTFDPLNRVKNLGEATNTGASDYSITSTAITLNYQSNGRRLNISRSGSSTIYNFTDGVHLSSFVQSFSGGSDNNLTNSFTYTAANQIHTLTQSNSNYFYAENENRTGAYVADGLNRYSSVADQPLAYDGNSNLTNDGIRVYTYDDENHLLSVSGSGLSASLYYDPNGRLFQTIINGSVRRFLFDGDALIAEYNSSNHLQRRYLHGDQVDEPLIQYNGTSATAANRIFLHADHQGSIIAQSSNSGTVTATLAYDAYGIPAAKNANVSGAFGYTGQIYLPELGLDYYKARMYHPKLGRFLQTDPIGYEDQINLYAYVGNDPVNNSDPSGMTGECSPDAKTCDTFTQTIPETRNGGPNQEFEGSAAQDVVRGLQNLDVPTESSFNGTSPSSSNTISDLAGKAWDAFDTLPPAMGPGEVKFGMAAIGVTGKIGEAILKKLGGISQRFFWTSKGPRFVDQFVNGAAHESKVGYTSLTRGVQLQVAKDSELLLSGRVNSVTWHFFQSPVTGLGGPSQPLLDLLSNNNINAIIW